MWHRHKFKHIAKNSIVNENLYECIKCGKYLIEHVGIGLHFISKDKNIDGWVYFDD